MLELDPLICENLNVVSPTATIVVSWTLYLLLPGISLFPTYVGLWLHPLMETTRKRMMMKMFGYTFMLCGTEKMSVPGFRLFV